MTARSVVVDFLFLYFHCVLLGVMHVSFVLCAVLPYYINSYYS